MTAITSPGPTPAARSPLTSRFTRTLSSVRVNSANSSVIAGRSGSASASSRRCSATPSLHVARRLRNGRLMRHWFEDVADHLGSAYLRYSFTKGTEQEVDVLVECLGLAPGARILDVGCGPGRHAHALGRRGFEVVGVDISERFVALAREQAPAAAAAAVTFERADARALRFDAEFDAVISLCQG